MKDNRPAVTPFWHTVRLLLGASRRRARSRSRRRQQLLQQRKAGQSASPSVDTPVREPFNITGMMTFVAFAAGALFQGFLAFGMYQPLEVATRLDMARHGQMVVSEHFFQDAFGTGGNKVDQEKAISDEAGRLKENLGTIHDENAAVLKQQLSNYGPVGFAHESTMYDNMRMVAKAQPLARAVSALLLAGWFVVMVCQGEGMELDFQRRRHPMWEWLLSHPVHQGAAFFAEMISPMAANPFYVMAPLFFIIIFAQFYPFLLSVMAGVLVALPVALAASFLNKTIEIGAMLRLSPRSRGAVLGIMSWIGYSAIVVAMILNQDVGVIRTLESWLQPVAPFLAVPILPWLVGAQAGGGYSLLQAIVDGWLFAGVIIAASLWLSGRATNQGLQGGFGDKPTSPGMVNVLAALPFLRDPLLKKELLWFFRDRGAVIQAILIPLTIGATQAFNFRHLAQHAADSWNYLCGFAIICGTYFLLILGPGSLLSEGPALWIPLTWPRGLESLLKAKARLWAIIADGIVALIFAFAMVQFPADAWKVAVVTVGWLVFAHGLAEKAVTLVPPMSSTGQTERVTQGRQWAAMLGTFSFASGVFVQDWHLAAIGVVFSSLTAAAMWQNFRARLPFLFDPWSEKLPPPPTLMHGMIAITGMVDGMALLSIPLGFAAGIFGDPFSKGGVMVVSAAAYAIAAVLAWWFTSRFLTRAGAPAAQIWHWSESTPQPAAQTESRVAHFAKILALGVAGGLALGVVALGYILVAAHLPIFREVLSQQAGYFIQYPAAKYAMAAMAIGMAPFAEEYLFRGLLFRALDREWGGWRAIVGSALFFAVYHSPYSWVPVLALGIFNAWLFKHTRSLWPCVLAHMAYNTVVTLAA